MKPDLDIYTHNRGWPQTVGAVIEDTDSFGDPTPPFRAPAHYLRAPYRLGRLEHVDSFAGLGAAPSTSGGSSTWAKVYPFAVAAGVIALLYLAERHSGESDNFFGE